jgi:hypothetical protein
MKCSIPTPSKSYTGNNPVGFWHNFGLHAVLSNNERYRLHTDFQGLPLGTGLSPRQSFTLNLEGALLILKNKLVEEGFDLKELNTATDLVLSVFREALIIDRNSEVILY